LTGKIVNAAYPAGVALPIQDKGPLLKALKGIYNQSMSKRTKNIAIPGLIMGLCLLVTICALPSISAAQNQPADQSGERYCIWLFWTKDPSLITQALERLAQGDPFMVVARDTASKHPKTSQANADCMKAGGMDPAVLAVAKDLRIGELSRPFDLGGGTAMVMRTTDAHRRKAQGLYSKRRFAQAERELLRDLKLHPASASAWHMLALTRTAQGNYKQALTALDKALALKPNNPAMLNDKASALANLGRSKEAIPVFEKAMKLDPENPTIMSNLAWALTLEKQDPKRALALAKKACGVAPREARVWHTLAKVQAAQGLQADALVSLRQTLILAPKHRAASQDLVKTVKALNPKVLARLNQDCAPGPAASQAKQKPTPKEETSLPKGLKPAPDLAGPGITLPEKWPALHVSEKQIQTKASAAADDETKPAAEAKKEAPAQAKPPVKTGKRIVSLPMPKFPEQAEQTAGERSEEESKQKATPEAKPQEEKPQAEAGKPETQTEKTQPEPDKKTKLVKDEPKEQTQQAAASEPQAGLKAEKADPEQKAAEPKEETKVEVDQAKTEPNKAETKPGPNEDQSRPRTEEQKPEPAQPAAELEEKQAQVAFPKPVEKTASKEPPAKPEHDKTDPDQGTTKPSEEKPVDTNDQIDTGEKPALALDKPHYLIQVASYRPEALAKKELRAWKKRKIAGHIEKWEDRRGRTWHRVLLGPFPTQKSAEKRARQLKKKRLVRDYYVVKRPAD
jgi:Flp pilus assembly protein TadD